MLRSTDVFLELQGLASRCLTDAGTALDCQCPPSWQSIRQQYSLLFCTAVRLGPHSQSTHTDSKRSINNPSQGSWRSSGGKASQTMKSCKEPNQLPSRQCSVETACAGWVTYPGWKTIVSQNSYCSVNWQEEPVIAAVPVNVGRTARRRIWSLSTLTTTRGTVKHKTVQDGNKTSGKARPFQSNNSSVVLKDAARSDTKLESPLSKLTGIGL